ncbi:MAG: hypothetical protein V3R34_01775 [Hyphomicrobium sp.]
MGEPASLAFIWEQHARNLADVARLMNVPQRWARAQLRKEGLLPDPKNGAAKPAEVIEAPMNHPLRQALDWVTSISDAVARLELHTAADFLLLASVAQEAEERGVAVNDLELEAHYIKVRKTVLRRLTVTVEVIKARINDAAETDETLRRYAESASISPVAAVYDVEVVNPLELERQYLTADMKRLRLAVKRGARFIPGTHIFPKESRG